MAIEFGTKQNEVNIIDKTDMSSNNVDIAKRIDVSDRPPVFTHNEIDIAKRIQPEKTSGLTDSLKTEIDGEKSSLSYDDKVKVQDKEIEQIEKHDLKDLSSQERGNYGEMKVDQDMRSKGYERISKEMVIDKDEDLKPGLDGVYFKKDGEPQYVILDAKFGQSQLGDTADGKQMSEKWIENRLDADVGKTKADEIRTEKILNPDNVGSYVARVDLQGDVSYTKLDSNAREIKGACEL